MILIKPMDHSHVAQVAALEKLCFTPAWSEKSIASELDNPLSRWFVALDGEQVTGYIGSQTVMDESDMMNVAVSSDYRRQGIGEALVEVLTDALKAAGSRSLTLEVRQSNGAAQKLYEKLGFVQVGLRPNYYVSPKESALIMRKDWEV